MNAELVLALIEEGLTVAEAKAIDATNPTSTAELVLALLENADVALSNARFVAERVIAKAPLKPAPRTLPTTIKPGETVTVETTEHLDEPIERARVHKVSVVGPDGLTDLQRSALGTVGLCPNCQQPNNNHLPGCARQSGEDPKAVTRSPLSPRG